jgi:hypothetical protein
MISIYDPTTYSNNYDDPSITQLSSISTKSIAAYSDLLSNNNLIIGATSNINFKAKNNIQLYFNQSNDISFYTTDNFGNNVKRIFSIGTSNDTTILRGSNLFFDISGNTNLWTNSNIIINPSNGGTGNANIYINSNDIGCYIINCSYYNLVINLYNTIINNKAIISNKIIITQKNKISNDILKNNAIYFNKFTELELKKCLDKYLDIK